MIKSAQKERNTTCIPWYLPPLEDPPTMCDPFEAAHFRLYNYEDCDHCLPDCQNAIYSNTISNAEFQRCDFRSFSTTLFCQLHPNLSPVQYYDMMEEEFRLNGMDELPQFIKDRYNASNIRKLEKNFKHFFSKVNQDYSYDAYKEDIAIAHFYFEKPTIMKFKRDVRYKFEDFMSKVGGLLGLFLGFSICSVIELIYWFTYKLFEACCSKRKRNSVKP